MRRGLFCLTLLAWAASVTGWGQTGKGEKAETLARWHFVGTKQLSNSKDLPVLRDILALKESQELRKVAIEGFSLSVADHFTHTNDTNINAQIAALIRPLLPDLIENESRFELSARGAQDADWSLALKLAHDRLGDWNTGLSNLASAAHMRLVPAQKGDGWTAEKDNYRISFSSEKDWLLLDGGFGPASARVRKAPKSGGKEVLTAEINCPAIARIWSAERFQHAPKLTFNFEPRKGALRSEMLVDYPQSLNITPEVWTVPTELVRDPLIGFTAVQGVRKAVEGLPHFKQLGSEKTPNQLFLWNQNLMAFTVFAAADVGNPAILISNIVAHVLPGMTNGPGGTITVMTNRPAILWRGLPVVAPFIEAADDGKSPYLVAGLFPVMEDKAKPAPAELFAQLKKKNLIYYDWEITQERMKQWRPIWQAAQILHGRIFGPSASDRWIEAVTSMLENTVTEGFLESPSRIKLVRQSQAGFTALELVMLAHLLDPYDVMERPIHSQTPGQPPVRRKLVPQKH